MKKLLLASLILLSVLFVLGLVEGHSRGKGRRSDLDSFTNSKVAEWLSDRYAKRVDLSELNNPSVHASENKFVLSPGTQAMILIPQSKYKSRKMKIVAHAGLISLTYSDYYRNPQGQRLSPQSWPDEKNASILATEKGGLLVLSCGFGAVCELRVR